MLTSMRTSLGPEDGDHIITELRTVAQDKRDIARREEVAQAALRLIGAQGLSALTTATLAAGSAVAALWQAVFAAFPTERFVLLGVDRLDSLVLHGPSQRHGPLSPPGTIDEVRGTRCRPGLSTLRP